MAKAAKGRPIKPLKKSTKDSFTAAAKRAGRTVQQQASVVLADPHASPAMKRKANFARNAAKWNHGGRRGK